MEMVMCLRRFLSLMICVPKEVHFLNIFFYSHSEDFLSVISVYNLNTFYYRFQFVLIRVAEHARYSI